MTIYTFAGTGVEITRVANDTNGNPRYVIHYLPLLAVLEKYIGKPHAFKMYDTTALHIKNASKILKPYRGNEYGGGFVFQSYNVQQDLLSIEHELACYGAWYQSERVDADVVSKKLDESRHYLSVVVKSRKGGYTCKGEWSLTNELVTKCDYDHSLIERENTLRAAMLWAKKCEYKRNAIDDRKIRILDQYTRLEANTVVYMYEFLENPCVTHIQEGV